MTYKVKEVLREIYHGEVFDYQLLNSFDVVVGQFHNKDLALKVRDLLNGDLE